MHELNDGAKFGLGLGLAFLLGVLICQVMTVPQRIGADLSRRADQAQLTVTALSWWLAMRADAQVTETRNVTVQQVEKTRAMLAREIATTRFAVAVESMNWRHTADKAALLASSQITGLRLDLAPTLDRSSQLLETGQFFVDDNYYDLSASVGSSTVMLASIARASDQLALAAGRMAEASTLNVENFAGISGNIKKLTDEVVKPKRWWQKALGPFYTIGRLAAAFL